MYRSPFSYSSRASLDNQIYNNKSISNKSPCSRDRFVSPSNKSPLRSPNRENIGSNCEFSSAKKSGTPTTPKSRKAPIVKDSVLDAPYVLNDFPTKLIDFNDDGCLAVALGTSVYLWNNNEEVVEMMSGTTVINSLCWMDEGLVISGSGHIELWDVQRQCAIQAFDDHDERAVGMSSYGHRLATGGHDGVIRVTDSRSGNSTTFTGHRGEICALSWSMDGAYLASGGNDNQVYIWGSHVQKRVPHDSPIQSLAWGNSGILYTGESGESGQIQMIRMKSDDEPKVVLSGSPLSGLCWMEEWGLIASHNGSSSAWETWSPDLKKIGSYTGHASGILNLASCSQKSLVSTIGSDETLRIWQLSEPLTSASPRTRSPSPFGNPFIR